VGDRDDTALKTNYLRFVFWFRPLSLLPRPSSLKKRPSSIPATILSKNPGNKNYLVLHSSLQAIIFVESKHENEAFSIKKGMLRKIIRQ
jgi:hypothetical protein